MKDRIIEYTDVKKYAQISDNIDYSKRINEYIVEAQELDLKPILGDALLLELLTQLDTTTSPPGALSTANDELYNGCTYTYSGRTYYHKGIIPMMAYFTYARFLRNNNYTNTAFGMVQKKTEEGEPVNERMLQALINAAREKAMAYQADMMLFLNRNYASYPLFIASCTNKFRSRITEIGD